MCEKVGQEVKSIRQTSVRNLYGETRHLMGCKCIQVAPKPIRFNGNVTSCPALRPFENRMFDEMADSVQFRGFVTRTASHPNPRGHRPQTGHVLSQNRDAVREFRRTNFVNHVWRNPKTGRNYYSSAS